MRGAPSPDKIDPFGPTFLSYRQSDGTELATTVAWALRTMGLPVWRDIDDLPPGDTNTRLQEAMSDGLSGAVLLVTQGVAQSTAIKEIEAPQLLRLHADPGFSFAIGNAIRREGAEEPDFGAPDRLLTAPGDGASQGEVTGTLKDVKQYPLLRPRDETHLARDLARRRMAALRQVGGDTLEIEIRTRAQPTAAVRPSGLSIRTRPPEAGSRLPHPDSWEPFSALLADLPQLVEESGARNVKVGGGAHLSMALALGTALPTPGGIDLAVMDGEGRLWRGSQDAPSDPIEPEVLHSGADGPVAIAIDIVGSPTPIDTFLGHMESAGFGGAMRLGRVGTIQPEAGGGLIDDIADQIKRFASAHSTTRVHLFLRVPFPVAVLLGRSLNTLEVTSYEWDDTVGPPQYVPTLTLSSGHGGGPVRRIEVRGAP